MRGRTTRASWALSAALLVATAACGNSGSSSTAPGTGGGGSGATVPVPTRSAAELSQKLPSDQPGVTDGEIKVASVASLTNPLGIDLSQAAKGAQAYFDMVNSQGGIYGRKLVVDKQLDDQMVKNKDTLIGLVSDNDAFAALPVTSLLLYGSDELADSGLPSFGWLANEEWGGHNNLFGEKGGYLNLAEGGPQSPFLAREIGAKKIAVVAYSQDQTLVCAEGTKKSFADRPGNGEVTFVDDAVPFGATDYAVTAQKIKDAGNDLVVACLDTNGSINLIKDLRKAGVTAPVLIQNGYESDAVDNFGEELEGSYVATFLSPAETPQPPPGVKKYLEWIAKVDGAKIGEQSMIGWANADLLYQGLVGAGPSFTRRSVIDAINQITDWNAEGVVPPVDWTTAHTQAPDPWCIAFVQVKDGRFVPVFGQPDKPIVCNPYQGDLPAEPTFR